MGNKNKTTSVYELWVFLFVNDLGGTPIIYRQYYRVPIILMVFISWRIMLRVSPWLLVALPLQDERFAYCLAIYLFLYLLPEKTI